MFQSLGQACAIKCLCGGAHISLGIVLELAANLGLQEH